MVNCTSSDVLGSPVTPADVAVGSFFVVAVLISFLPQMISIFKAKSSFGLSPAFLSAAMSNACCLVQNIFLIEGPQLQCCHSEWSASECGKQMLKLESLVVQALCIGTNITLFIRYTDRKSDPAQWQRAKRLFCGVAALQILFAAIALIVVSIKGVDGHATVHYADALGYAAACFACVQTLPQILTTYRLKDPGALSIFGLVLQAPGSFGWGAYLLFGGGGGSGISTCLSMLVNGTLQFVLLFLALYYKMKNSKKAKLASDDADIENERLLKSATIPA